MVVLDVFPMVALRGGKRVTSYLTERGFTYGEARTLALGKGVVQVKDRTVLRLCEALGCTPSDLFSWRGAETDALAVLNTRRPKPVYELLAGLGPEEVEAFWQKVRERQVEHGERQVVTGGKLGLNVARMLRMRSRGPRLKTLQGMGLTEMEARAVLSDWRSGLRMGLLTKLCKAFDCLPDDLYAFEGPEGHVLSGLRREVPVDLSKVPLEVFRGLMD